MRTIRPSRAVPVVDTRTVLGNVTTIIQSYEKANASYRDQMSVVNSFTEQHPMSRLARRRIVTYTDAYFKARIDGVEQKKIVAGLPAHLRPQVLLEMHRSLISESCRWMHACTYIGCTSFLERLQPEVCLKGDCLIRAGCEADILYILREGELEIAFPLEGDSIRRVSAMLPPHMKEELEKRVGSRDSTPNGMRSGAAAQAPKRSSNGEAMSLFSFTGIHRDDSFVQEPSSSHGRREPRRRRCAVGGPVETPTGRLDRPGTLIGWQPPYKPRHPERYTARAMTYSQLLSISRDMMREVLERHPEDAPVFRAAAERAAQHLKGPEELNAAGSRVRTRSLSSTTPPFSNRTPPISTRMHSGESGGTARTSSGRSASNSAGRSCMRRLSEHIRRSPVNESHPEEDERSSSTAPRKQRRNSMQANGLVLTQSGWRVNEPNAIELAARAGWLPASFVSDDKDDAIGSSSTPSSTPPPTPLLSSTPLPPHTSSTLDCAAKSNATGSSTGSRSSGAKASAPVDSSAVNFEHSWPGRCNQKGSNCASNANDTCARHRRPSQSMGGDAAGPASAAEVGAMRDEVASVRADMDRGFEKLTKAMETLTAAVAVSKTKGTKPSNDPLWPPKEQRGGFFGGQFGA